MGEPLFSIRMRASRNGHHISGAERLVDASALENLTGEMAARAMEHPHGRPDSIHISIDPVSTEKVRFLSLPDLTTVRTTDFVSARAVAVQLLEEAGVTAKVARDTMSVIASGASPRGGNMRGAMLVDAGSGIRLETDPERGIRVSRMDLTSQADAVLRKNLAVWGLDRPQVREALVLAGKVLAAPGIVAEVCWSDDPDYTAGYVASPRHGYVRFPALKASGCDRGGRAFFVRASDSDRPGLVQFLEYQPVLFNRPGRIHPAISLPRG